MRRICVMVALAALGCAPSALDDTSVVCVQVPAGGTAFDADSGAPSARYPLGSRLVLAQAGSGEARDVLAGEFAVAGFPCVSWDAKHVLFAAKETPAAAWAIHELDLGSRRHRTVTAGERDRYAPAYLADGRIVYVADLGGGVSELHTCATDGTGAERITFHQARVLDPTALADGRVLYVVESLDANASPQAALYTVNVDGTLVRAVTRRDAVPLCKPRETGSGEIALVAGGCAAWTSLALQSAPRTILATRVASIAAWDDQSWLVSLRSPPSDHPSSSKFAVAWLDRSRDALRAASVRHPEDHLVDAVRVCATPRARAHVSTVNAKRATGELLCLNASLSGTPLAHRPRYLRVTAHAGDGGVARVLGETALAADGSVFIEVPADQPIRLELLDTERLVVGTECGWIWVRPGERHGCVGCHESPALAPRNQRPLAIDHGAVALTGASDLPAADAGHDRFAASAPRGPSHE